MRTEGAGIIRMRSQNAIVARLSAALKVLNYIGFLGHGLVGRLELYERGIGARSYTNGFV